MMGHNAGLEVADSVYPFSRTDIRTFNIAEGNFGINLEDMWQGEVPSRFSLWAWLDLRLIMVIMI